METNRRTTRFLIDDGVDMLKKGDVRALYRLWELYIGIDTDPEPEGEDRYWQAYALYHFGIALQRYKHHAHALEVLSKCASRFERDSDEDTAYLVNQSLINAAIVAHEEECFAGAIQNLDQSINRLQSSTDIEDRRLLATALVNRAGSILKSGRAPEAVTAFTAAYARFKEDNDPHVCRQIAYALQERARILLELSPGEVLAAKTLIEFLVVCVHSKDPAIAARVSATLARLPRQLRDRALSTPETNATVSRHARYLVEDGMNHIQTRETSETLAKFEQAIQLFGDNPEGEDQIWLARAMLNRGFALERAQRNDEAIAVFTKIISRFQDSSDLEIQKVVTSARGDLGVAAGAIRQFDKAISYLDATIDHLKNASHRDDRRRLSQAMYNRATMFRQAGRTDEAVQAFDATYEQFAQDDDPKVCQFVALAVFNKANGLRKAGQRDRAMIALRSAFDRCAESHDPMIRERAVRALFSLAGEHAALEQRKEWAETLDELAVRCGSAAEAAIQEVIARALEVCPLLLTSLPAASHSLRSEYNRQGFITILSEVGDRSDLLDKAWKEHYEDLETKAKEARDSHTEALRVLSAHWLEKKPFAVFLRNFASESYEFSTPVEGADFPLRMLFQKPIEAVEERIKAAVGPGIPLITISNPTPSLSGGSIPRLEMRNEIWETAVKIVIRIAGLILVKLDDVSRGVLTELQTIINEGRQFSTVVIVSHAMKDHELAVDLKKAQLAGGRAPSDPSIPRFPFVIDESKLPEPGGESLVEIYNLMLLNGVVH